MRTTTATAARKELFGVLEKAVKFIPTRIKYKKGNAVILAYDQYLALKKRKKDKKSSRELRPLLSGRILKPLNERAEEELVRYMGL